ncbi:MAG: hypothetical protein H6835_12850 [Planctomycetes bacterium]|nr:hypothetical protein [Planctomycetota bacterium]
MTGAEKVGCQRRFEELLLDVPTRDLEGGWRLARDLGRPVAPLLWEMVQAEKSNVERRLVLLAAAVLAGGVGEDERLFAWLAQPRPLLEERVLAGFLLAMGPRRSRAMPGFWGRLLGPARTPEQLLGIAARLAAARFPDSALDAPTTQGNDPGMLAAAAYCGLSLSAPQLTRMSRGEDRHVALFWRGAMLGECWRMAQLGQEPALGDRAAALLTQREPADAELIAAAMLLCARSGRLDPGAARPEFQLLRVVAGEVASRDALRRWLSPTPLARDEQPARLGVAYALMMPVDDVVATSPQWGGQPRVRAAMALALALRLCGGARASRPLPTQLAGVPEWAFCVWAAGGRFAPEGGFGDPYLAAIAELVAAGRCSRAACRDALEDVLWRQGCHPGWEAFMQERLLVRDLLLSGSKWGGGRYQPHVRPEHRYFATGLDRSDEFFTIAVSLYEVLQTPVAPIPVEYRLR